MILKTTLAAWAAVMLCGAAFAVSERETGPVVVPHSNGTEMNGISINGASFNGASLGGTGISLNGGSLNGMKLQGMKLQGMRLQGTETTGTRFDAGALRVTSIALPE